MNPESEGDGTSGDSLFGQIAEEYTMRLRCGEQPDIEQYVRRYPNLASLIRTTLPLLEALGNASLEQEQHSLPGSDVGQLGGERLGDFHLLREIGRGGMGVIYEAEQLSLGRRVALKILPFAALLNEGQLRRFQTETTAAARLQHPHIVPVYTVGCERGVHFYAMQIIDGPSLAEVIAQLRQRQISEGHSKAVGQPDTAETIVDAAANALTRDSEGADHYRSVARIGREAAEALHYAHEHGVLHRDIKPSNLLLDAAGHVWIADFGLARVEDESQLTRTGDVLGTLRYMSPEQASGQGDTVDSRSDVYSLGATLYELATLRPVFDRSTRRTIVKQVVAGDPVAPHKMDRRITRPLSLIISKAMARRPEDRYQSARELAEDLQRFLSGDPVQARPSTLRRRAKEWPRRHRVASAVSVAILVVAFAATPLTHHWFQRIPAVSLSKGDDMKSSTAAKVASVIAAVSMLASDAGAGKPAPPPPTPIIATTTDANFLEFVVGKLSCQTEFSLAISVSETATHYRYKVGPSASTDPGVLTGYSAPIPKATPLSFNLTGQADGGYVLCLQGLELDSKGRIKKSQPLDQATAYYWMKDTPPVEYHVTFIGDLGSGVASIYGLNDTPIAVGRAPDANNIQVAFRWSEATGIQDLNTLSANWLDLQTNEYVTGWRASTARDVNESGQIVGNATDGNSTRGFVFDEVSGFLLLPTLGNGSHLAFNINEQGEVLGQWRVDSNYNLSVGFFWTPMDRANIVALDPRDPKGIRNSAYMMYTGTVANLYSFGFTDGIFFDHLVASVSVSASLGATNINESGSFAYAETDGSSQFVKFYDPLIGSNTVAQTAGRPELGMGVNNSGDFGYQLDRVPYLYRATEGRTYRLYDLADSDTKDVLFDATGHANSSAGMPYLIVSDSNAAGAPTSDPFDTISGIITGDPNPGTHWISFILTPVPKQLDAGQ